MAEPLLNVAGLEAWYGESHILHGVDFNVGRGELVTLLGRNGVGKTTTLKSIMGIVDKRRGSVTFEGRETVGQPSNVIARQGIAYCPEERGIFSSLTVEENLLLPPAVKPGGMSLAEIYQLFPNLEERRRGQGTKLSGGEQQMLAIGRALMSQPKVVLLDEPSLGLAPMLVEEIFGIVQRLVQQEKLSVLLVEQNATMALGVADHGYVMENGRIVLEGSADKLRQNSDIKEFYLGLNEGGARKSYRDTKHYKRRKRWLS